MAPNSLQNLPDFRWLVPDRILKKVDREVNPSDKEILKVVQDLLIEEKKREEV